ncbi:hypothetical protein QUF79_07330 [Fictibacillus enclensis]|uniref:hypothetical protein n=1 Tax=Fictibacillus enclensis TaxID=1017270 RepID=UPI0025A293E0|nr:hypothetical protein [Fictibacillus enclensis]MDM5197827.1 hypothetical protein [Fictibacillus enclensis]
MKYVWYASYGSNMNKDRFSCYIEGTQAEGSSEPERGCRNCNPPLEDRSVEMEYPLYFSKQESKWGAGGVAFIGHQPAASSKTIGRMYLITEEQFMDVASQENGIDGLEFDFEKIKEARFLPLTEGWYGTIVYLGDCDGYPIFSFTSNHDMGEEEYVAPAPGYLRTIAKGLKAMGMTDDDILDYLGEKNGLKSVKTREQIKKDSGLAERS